MLSEKFMYKQLLGEGSFGTVSLVQFQNQEIYALKEVKVDPFVIEQALKEIQVMSNINHQHVVKIVDSKFDGVETLQILMEYCQKGDLQSHLLEEQKKLTIEQLLKIVKQIVKAFITMNVHGIIHRDLKPQNILVNQKQIVKIADFGCATKLQESFLSKLYNLSYDKGTANYSSPQELMGLPYSARCDVWALGCLVYSLYFGFHPFSEITVAQTLAKIKELTENKKIIIKQKIDSRIHKLLSMSLVFEDAERATWREISLSRVLEPPIQNIEAFLSYLCSLTNISNWITKQFWKARKLIPIESQKNYFFAYFMIKYQFSNMSMALQIVQNSKEYSYLFNQIIYKEYQPSPQIYQQILTDFQASKSYFKESKLRFQKKDVYPKIEKKDCKRKGSVFADLDNSIKVCYKILKNSINKLQIKARENPEQYSIAPVWLVMSKWINFEHYLNFQNKITFPNFPKQLKSKTALKQILKNIYKYENGIIQ